ncbi:MAG: nicotinamide mononucleotide transporter [Phycisphaerales bacterium]|jgi:nicotinamide mononucleotide transporter|nr:nicotinamide mononucleotide transporter [Phycisphaerales bacterium]MDB5303756.1 nicotinamide mononucleotide transporter [Phycisphaerales bacterium]
MSVMDWIGFVTGVVCVFLIVREKDINWPIGILNSVALLAVFWTQRLYAQAGLQAFYVVECAYGWRMWTRRDQATGTKLIRIGRTKNQTLALLSIILAAGILGLYPVFRATGDPAPFWDSVIAVMSLVAEYMLCLKFFESWGVYFAADLISLVVLALLGMWVTFGTYLCFTALCIMGIVEWRKRMRRNSEPASSLASSTL